MTLKRFAIKSILTEDYYSVEWYQLPQEIKTILQTMSNDVFQNDQVWPKIPNSIQEMVNFDNLKDEEDNYKIYVDSGDFYWCSNSMSFYLDINQWMLLDPEIKDQYEYKITDLNITAELEIEITNIYNKPTVSEINLTINTEGDAESFRIYPNRTLKYPMTKEEIIQHFGDVYEED